MKPALVLLLLALLPLSGQSEDLPGVPATTNIPGQNYPRILPDLRVVFSVKAPTAQAITFGVADKPYPAVRDANGVWTVTTDPQVPGFHYYWIVADGRSFSDPASETFYGYGRESSGIEIPEAGVNYSDIQDVPHGEIREHWYYAKTTSEWRRVFIYTPPGYDADSHARYPTLYLQHGSGEDERGWSSQGRVNFILDNLIAEGKATPMLVIMETGYARQPGEPNRGLGPPPPPPKGSPPVPWDLGKMFQTYEDVMVHDLIPAIDAAYRTKPDREHRAIAGLSMGGMQAFQIGLGHLDLFDYLGGFSGAGGGAGDRVDLKTANRGVMADAAAFNRKVRVVFLGIGTAEPERMLRSVQSYHDTLKAAGINHVFYQSPGTAHEWLTWRRDLHEFAPLLFQDIAGDANSVRTDFLRLIDRPRVPAAPALHRAEGNGGLERWNFTYASDAQNRVPGILVKRAGSTGRRPVVIALHGTGGNKEGELGFASEMAQAGFLGVVIDGRYHGERAPSGQSSVDYQAAILRAYRGNGEHPLFYDTVWDVMRLIDYLSTRDDVDPTRIGLFGISKGGIETYLTAAVDPRVAVAVPCLAVQGFEWELAHNAWQSRAGTFSEALNRAAQDAGVARPDAVFLKAFYAKVAPGIDSKFDGPSMVPLIAPRPLLAINGDSDARTPRPGLDEIAAQIQSAYAALRAADRFTLMLEPNTAHKVTAEGNAAAQAWFVRWLKP